MSSEVILKPTGVFRSSAVTAVERLASARSRAKADAISVRRFLNGDEAAFDQIVARHRDRIFHLVSRCLDSRSDVEEVVDDTFIRAYRGLAKFRGESSVATWLHHIAINLARNRYWMLLRRRQFGVSLDAPLGEGTNALTEFVASTTPTPRQELEWTEYTRRIVTCINQLPLRQRDALRLRGILNKSYEDIAATLHIDVATVKSRIARARRHLRAQLDEDRYAENTGCRAGFLRRTPLARKLR